MPTKLAGKWTLRQIMRATLEAFPSRIEYYNRDVVKTGLKIQAVIVYDGKNPGQSRTKYVIQSYSYPQYYPYYTKVDKRGRKRSYQRTYKHNYEIIIQLDRLSIDVPVKMRTGSNRKYVFKPNKNLIRSKNNPNGKYLSVGDYNIVALGINPDFEFTQSFVRQQEGVLFGKNYMIGPPTKANPKGIVFMTKHEWGIVKTLLERGILKKDF